MPKRKAAKNSKRNYSEMTEVEESHSDGNDERIIIPDPDYSNSDKNSASSNDEISEFSVPHVSYTSVFQNYSETQKIGT